MSKLDDIAPKECLRVIDLVSTAGIDVSDWQNFKRGQENAASNPKYCYEWVFVDEDKQIIVLSLSHSDMRIRESEIERRLNMQEAAARYEGVKKTRALKMDSVIQKAFNAETPVRVIVHAESNRKHKRTHRLLDSEHWAVTSYEFDTGACIITRGFKHNDYMDQFDLEPLRTRESALRATTTYTHVRSAQVRKEVLTRAKGKCEWCGQPGFQMQNDKIYLETHHVVPLCENGSDNPTNIIALCSNHHREAHYGKNGISMRKDFLKLIGPLG